MLTGVTAAEVNTADVQQELLQKFEGAETVGEPTVLGHRLMAGGLGIKESVDLEILSTAGSWRVTIYNEL